MRADIDSPFAPGQIVRPERFIGRDEQLERLNERLRLTARGNFSQVFISGPRGIGKSSLALKIKQLGEQNHQLIGVHVFLSGVDTVEGVVHSVFNKLLNESRKLPWFDKVKEFFGNSVNSLDLFGLKLEFNPHPTELTSLSQRFGQALVNFCERIGPAVKGLVIVLDDINGLAEQPQFANWLKATIDDLQATTPVPPVFLLIVGHDGRREKLLTLQPSLDRILNPVKVEPWSLPESQIFFFNTLLEASVEAEPEAVRFMAHMCGGFPVMAHEIGDAAFYLWRRSKEVKLTKDLVVTGTLQACEEIGRKYLDQQFFGAIRGASSRAVLQAIAQQAQSFTRQGVLGLLGKKQIQTFDDLVARLRKMGFIEGGLQQERGTYRWVNPMHYVYVRLYSRAGDDHYDVTDEVAEIEADQHRPSFS